MDSLLDGLRRPSYTGENRCWPCTILNGVVLALLIGTLLARGRKRAALAVGSAGVAGITLRGYLIPYTPRFAPTLAAALPIDVFEHDQDSRSGSLADADGSAGVSTETADRREKIESTETADRQVAHPTEDPASLDVGEDDPAAGEAVLDALLEAGVVRIGESDGAVELDPAFREAWHEEMATLRTLDLESLAEVATALTPPAVETRVRRGWDGQSVILQAPDARPVTLQKGVAIAELATARTLEGRVDDHTARAAGRPLRSLLEVCPLCGDSVTISQSSCCGEVTPLGKQPAKKLVCPSCDVRFFTFE